MQAELFFCRIGAGFRSNTKRALRWAIMTERTKSLLFFDQCFRDDRLVLDFDNTLFHFRILCLHFNKSSVDCKERRLRFKNHPAFFNDWRIDFIFDALRLKNRPVLFTKMGLRFTVRFTKPPFVSRTRGGDETMRRTEIIRWHRTKLTLKSQGAMQIGANSRERCAVE